MIVWIHGGGNTDGESNDYNGSKLARGGRFGGTNTVVVTLNYRLGLLGYLANPALDSEGHLFANYGLMDQQAALRWVQRNIAAFGGDPHRVALGGQSAGAANTDANVISPFSRGLFDRAISQSAVKQSFDSLSDALSRGAAFAKAAGCSGSNTAVAACLRKLSVKQILKLQGTTTTNGPFVAPGEDIVDGKLIPRQPQDAWMTGDFTHMPMMTGHTKDEANFDIGITEFNSSPRQPISAAQYVATVMKTYVPPTYPAGTAAKVLAEYPLSNYPSPQLALAAVETDAGAHGGGCIGLHEDSLVARDVSTYAYEFDDEQAPYYFPAMPGFTPGAPHTIDIQFLFPLYHGGNLGIPHPLDAQQTKLSNELVAAWTHFAATGNPNGAGNAPWPRFTGAADGSYLSENVPRLSTFSASQYSAEHHCGFWNPILGL